MTDEQNSIMVDGVEWFTGDTVKIVRKVEGRHPTGHCGECWKNAWVSDMTELVGAVSSIAWFDGHHGVLLTTGNGYGFPSSALQNLSAEQRESGKKAKEQAMSTKKEVIMVDGVEWRVGDRVVCVEDSCGVHNISEFVGDNIVLFEGYPFEYPVPTKVFVNVSAIGREQAKEVAPAPTIGGVELKPWMRVETAGGNKHIVCFGMENHYGESVLFVRKEGFSLLSENTGGWEIIKVYDAPDYPTIDPNKHGPLLWSKAGDEAKKEAEAKKKEAMTALEAAEVGFEAAKQRYNEAYAKLVAITD